MDEYRKAKNTVISTQKPQELVFEAVECYLLHLAEILIANVREEFVDNDLSHISTTSKKRLAFATSIGICSKEEF